MTRGTRRLCGGGSQGELGGVLCFGSYPRRGPGGPTGRRFTNRSRGPRGLLRSSGLRGAGGGCCGGAGGGAGGAGLGSVPGMMTGGAWMIARAIFLASVGPIARSSKKNRSRLVPAFSMRPPAWTNTWRCLAFGPFVPPDNADCSAL
jgi:hypothetical protein